MKTKLLIVLTAMLFLSGCHIRQGDGSSPIRIVKIESFSDGPNGNVYLYRAEQDNHPGIFYFYDTRRFRVGSTIKIVVTEQP